MVNTVEKLSDNTGKHEQTEASLNSHIEILKLDLDEHIKTYHDKLNKYLLEDNYTAEVTMFPSKVTIENNDCCITVLNYQVVSTDSFDPIIKVKGDIYSGTCVIINLLAKLANEFNKSAGKFYSLFKEYVTRYTIKTDKIKELENELGDIMKMENQQKTLSESETIMSKMIPGSTWYVQTRQIINFFKEKGTSIVHGKLRIEKVSDRTVTILYYTGIVDKNNNFEYILKDSRRLKTHEAIELLAKYDTHENPEVSEKINQLNCTIIGQI